MPKVSIIIPVYNTELFLGEALESVQNQTLQDIEAVVVDDGSTDGSHAIAKAYASKDKRFRVIHRENGGLHLARKTGVEAACGEYSLFLDSDDMLEEDACERLYEQMSGNPVDILHFGVSVDPIDPSDEAAASEFEIFANSDIGFLEGPAIANAIFDEMDGYQLDWRTWQRLFPTDFLKSAYNLMSINRLERAEDSHEGLVIACLASTFDSMDGYRGYRYRYGSGVSVGGSIDAETFKRACVQFRDCIDASMHFGEEHQDIVEAAWLQGLRRKCREILANDWLDRVPEDEKPVAYEAFAEHFGGTAAARELYRFVRDRAYSLLSDKTIPDSEDSIYRYCRMAEHLDLSAGNDADKKRLCDMRRAALNHLDEISSTRELTDYGTQDIRIFVTMHDWFDKPADPIFQPVQVGPRQFEQGGRFAHMFHDADGDSIADANARYCEMTVQYWAWKNIDAEYYGFCHYRRYFNFSDNPAIENAWGEVEEPYITDESCRRYGLDAESVHSCMGDADVLFTEVKDISLFPDGNRNMYEHYRNAVHLRIEDLDTLIDVIADLQPEYLEDAEKYLLGSKSCFCNMYVMKKAPFHEYCAWAFPLLEEFERRTDMTHYSKQELRVTGHLAERLFNIYLIHNQRSDSPWITKQVQCVRFGSPYELKPLRRAFSKPAVPVVFAADDNYSPMLGTAIYSLVDNSNDSRNYDIVVLSRGISGRNQRLMRESIEDHDNVSLRFFDVSRLVSNYELTVNEHITEETYYRFLIQWILPDYPKVLYLDSDLVVNADVASLYDTELGENLLAAVIDVDWAGICNAPNSDRIEYAKEKLGMADPYSYFQAGVLLLNTLAMSQLHTLDEWLALAATPHIFNDQDVLNQECEGRIRYLDLEWNMLVDTGRLEVAIQYAPAWMLEGYLESRNRPKIVHYAGAVKPWNVLGCDFSELFWRYARDTPYYEILIERILDRRLIEDWTRHHDEFLVEQGSRSPIRKIADVILPYGSHRRVAMRRFFGLE